MDRISNITGTPSTLASAGRGLTKCHCSFAGSQQTNMHCILANNVSKHLIFLEKEIWPSPSWENLFQVGSFSRRTGHCRCFHAVNEPWLVTALHRSAFLTCSQERIPDGGPSRNAYHLLHELCLPKCAFLYVLQACPIRQPQATCG